MTDMDIQQRPTTTPPPPEPQAPATTHEPGTGLEVNGLNLYYGDFLAVKDVNVTLRRNRVTALIGSSGCGKSTFLRSINRMHELVPGARVEGTVRVEGEDIYAPGLDAVVVRQRIGMVFQQPNPFPTMSIYDNVAAGLKLNNRKVGKADARRHRREVAARRAPVGRGQGPARQAGRRALRRPAAAPVHRAGVRRRAGDPAHGRAGLGA